MNSAVVSATASCGLCTHLFCDPRMLPCLHSFCYKCILKHFELKENSICFCPTCNQEFTIPNGGINAIPKDLRGSYEANVAEYEAKITNQSGICCDRCVTSASSKNSAIKFCNDCCMFLCDQCSEDHRRCRVTYTHKLVDVGEEKRDHNARSLLNIIPRKIVNCQFHPDEELKFYCETCSALICRDCIVVTHTGHSFSRVDKIVETERDNLMSILSEVVSVAKKFEDAVAQGEKTIHNIKMKQKFVDHKIREDFEQLYDALRCRENFLLTKISELGHGKINSVRSQNEEVNKLYNEITRLCKKMNEATQVYTPEEMLSAKGTMIRKFESLKKQLNNNMCSLDPCESDSMPTSFSSTISKDEIDKLGVFIGGCHAPASTAAIYMSNVIKNKVMEIIVTARNIHGKPYSYGGEVVKAELRLVGAENEIVFGKIKDNDDGTYEVSIIPQVVGEYQLNITISSKGIKFAPFSISVREQRDYSSPLSCLQTFTASSQPWDVAFSDNDEMFLVDYGYHCVTVMTKTGDAVSNFGLIDGGYGNGNGQFYNPSGIAIQGDVIYVAENSNNRVQKLTTSGKFLSKFGSSGSCKGQLSSPCGICIDPEGNVYISECSNNRISVFGADGTFDHYITGNLSSPWGIAFDATGKLHVANYGLNLVKVFTPDGTYVTEYGHGVIKYPAGIAIDPEGYIFVCEDYSRKTSYDYSRLFILNPQFQLINTIQGFRYAVGVALDKDGYIYICDQGNKRICKY